MTIHLGWMTLVWLLAGLGAAVVIYVVVGLVILLLFFHD